MRTDLLLRCHSKLEGRYQRQGQYQRIYQKGSGTKRIGGIRRIEAKASLCSFDFEAASNIFDGWGNISTRPINRETCPAKFRQKVQRDHIDKYCSQNWIDIKFWYYLPVGRWKDYWIWKIPWNDGAQESLQPICEGFQI